MNFVGVAANAGSSTLGSGANGISRTVTAGASGVTANLLAAKDTSNPTRYQTAAVNTCGDGIAAYTATSGNTFELYTVDGTVLTMVADGTITAGHLVTGGASTAGRVADTGQAAQTSVAMGTCIVGSALASATVGNTVLVAYFGVGTYGSSTALFAPLASPTFTGVVTYPLIATTTNCSSAASPAVCGAAPAGAVAIPTGVNPTLIVNTTAVTANSRIFLWTDDTTAPGSATCNSTLATLVGGSAITARTPGTSFTISFNGTVTTNPVCMSYFIVN